MPSPFRRNLFWSLAGHVALLLLVGAVVAFSPAHKTTEAVQWMDLAPDLGAPALAPSAPSGLPAPPEPVPEPVPEPAPEPEEPPPPAPPEAPPPKPTPKPPKPDAIAENPVPKPPPKKETPKPRPSRSRVVLQTNRVVRLPRAPSAPSGRAASAKASRPAPSTDIGYDPQAFARRLLTRMRGSEGLVTAKGATGTGTGGAGQPNPFAWYFNRIFQEMYAAWQPPFGLEEGRVSRVLIRIEKNGTISKVSLAAPSGDSAMDDSALAAAHRVKKLPPLPEGLGGAFAEITVHFKVQRP
ncbi:MAG: TonB C-terminal domain-containing protein [Verrucomicrobiae bacterium]|nr:TonB C-terminal domain-containing protein [Verrucomicrobiae bacterium]